MLIHGTNMFNADTDGDGLRDGDEFEIYHTNPKVSDANTDTDGDGLSDVKEIDGIHW